MSQDETLRELRRISKVLILSNAPAIEKELSKIASSDDRKRMWIYMDGKRMPKDLASMVGVTAMAVSVFLNAGIAASFIEYEKGKPPTRLLDYVPPAWLPLVKLPAEGDVETKSPTGAPSVAGDAA